MGKVSTVNIRLAKNLCNYMRMKNKTQLALAVETGISRQTISNYAHGVIPAPDINHIRKIAEALGVTVREMLKEED